MIPFPFLTSFKKCKSRKSENSQLVTPPYIYRILYVNTDMPQRQKIRYFYYYFMRLHFHPKSNLCKFCDAIYNTLYIVARTPHTGGASCPDAQPTASVPHSESVIISDVVCFKIKLYVISSLRSVVQLRWCWATPVEV